MKQTQHLLEPTLDGQTGELICHYHPQSEEHAHTIVLLIQNQSCETQWMQLTTSSIIVGQKANQNNLYHYYFHVMLVGVA